jgi:hypothetical protein
MGYVYLIQPSALVGTDRYKIGMSEVNNLSRLQSYNKNTRYLVMMDCEFPRKVESRLINAFKRKFVCISGKEYFQVDIPETELIQLFMLIISNPKKEEKKYSNTIDWMGKFAYRV